MPKINQEVGIEWSRILQAEARNHGSKRQQLFASCPPPAGSRKRRSFRLRIRQDTRGQLRIKVHSKLAHQFLTTPQNVIGTVKGWVATTLHRRRHYPLALQPLPRDIACVLFDTRILVDSGLPGQTVLATALGATEERPFPDEERHLASNLCRSRSSCVETAKFRKTIPFNTTNVTAFSITAECKCFRAFKACLESLDKTETKAGSFTEFDATLIMDKEDDDPMPSKPNANAEPIVTAQRETPNWNDEMGVDGDAKFMHQARVIVSRLTIEDTEDC
jgi:hypothetical protein